MTTATINEQKLQEFLGRALNDFGAVFNGALMVIGDKLGLYRALAGAGPLTSEELAQRTGTSERYIREWLNAQAAGGYVEYDPATASYTLPDEHAIALADENSPFFLGGHFQTAVAAIKSEAKVAEAFRTGEGIGWHEHDSGVVTGTARAFKPGYLANLVNAWIPALEGVEEKLRQGARVADVGSGYGASTILLAQAYPNSTFVGFDYHETSIERARKAAEEAGVSDRVKFQAATAKNYPGNDYDLVAMFDALHDMGDPVGAVAHAYQSLKPGGALMIVEPHAGDSVEENLNPLGRAMYGASTLICTPGSLSQEVGLALGTQAGESRTRQVVEEGGFTQFRRATDTPFNIVYEARK